MMTEDELRRELQELDTFWERELARRGGTGNPMPPADCYWYIYTRQAYLRVLGISTASELVSEGKFGSPQEVAEFCRKEMERYRRRSR